MIKTIPLFKIGAALALVLPSWILAQQPAGPPPGTTPAPPPPESPVPAPVPPVTPPLTIQVPGADQTNTTLEARLSRTTIGIGEQAELTFIASDGLKLEGLPTVIDVTGLSIQFLGKTEVPFRVGGRTRNVMKMQFSVEGVEAGNYTIPAQTFAIDGKKFTSKPVQIVVSDGPPVEESMKPQAQLVVGKTEMWEGEEVAVGMSVMVHRATQMVSSPFPVIKTDGIAVSRFDRSARIDTAEINGQLWNSWQLNSSMVALKPGNITLGPAEVKLEIMLPLGNTRPDPYSSYATSRRTLKVKSNSVNIHVKPLPTEGKPDGFTGAVGTFQLFARTDSPADGGAPAPVDLGGPVGFELMVTGMGNFDAVSAPVLEKTEGLRAYKPRVSLENRGLGTEPGQKAFTQIIFTEKKGPVSVVFTLPYFDPVAGKYAVAKSPPLEFVVTGDETLASAASNASAAETKDFGGATQAAVPGEELQDILPNALAGSRWYSLSAATIPVNPYFLHGVPALVLALLLGTGTVRRLKAWQLANRPPPYAPRECTDISGDLHRGQLSRLQFYGFVSEYVHAWEYWKKQNPPADEKLSDVLAARDRWLYAANAAAAAGPVPPEEQKQVTATLTSRLTA